MRGVGVYCDTIPLADIVTATAFFYPLLDENHCPPGCAASVVAAFGICFGVPTVGDRIGLSHHDYPRT